MASPQAKLVNETGCKMQASSFKLQANTENTLPLRLLPFCLAAFMPFCLAAFVPLPLFLKNRYCQPAYTNQFFTFIMDLDVPNMG